MSTITSFDRLVWLFDRLVKLNRTDQPVIIFRSTDIAHAMRLNERYARRLLTDWYEDGYLKRKFSGTEAKPRYDYTLSAAAISELRDMDQRKSWYAVALVNDDIKRRSLEDSKPAGSSVLNQRRMFNDER